MRNQEKIFAQLNKSLEAEDGALPIFSAVSMRLQLELIKEEPDLKLIARLIGEDQSLASTILRLANSTLLGGITQITTVPAAIMRLGMEEIMHVACVDINNNLFSSPDPQLDELMKKLWSHSVASAYGAAMLAGVLDCGVVREEAFSAGLFHDIGKLLILKVIEKKKKYYKVLDMDREDLLEAIAKLHAKHGYLLMERIKLPKMYWAVARDHHQKKFDLDNSLIVITRLANLVCHKLGIGLVHEPEIDILSSEEAIKLRLNASDLAKLEHFLRHNQTITELIACAQGEAPLEPDGDAAPVAQA